MPDPTTTRMGLTEPQESDIPDGAAQISALATQIDGQAAIYGQGTLSARPGAGTVGRIYYATDTALFYWDTGSAWVTVSSPATTVPIGALLAQWALCG